MFFVISKILKVFLLPLTWIFLLFILAYLSKNKKWRKKHFIIAIIILLVFSNKPLLQWSQYMTTRSYSHQQLHKKYYKVAVVLGGFGNGGMDTVSMQPNYIDDRGARLWEAIRLYEAGTVEKIMISGDATVTIDKKGNSTADALKKYLEDFGIHDSDLILEQHARNTRENATMSIAILDSLGYNQNDCLLVTSATHMKRSLACFEACDWTLEGYATNIYPKPHPKLYHFIPSWKTLIDWHELLNEWVGGIVYKIVGY